jgi:hypothetical protein
MKSETLPAFWENYAKLEKITKAQARKAYFLWSENHSHPSLRFKCVNSAENIWSVRISRNYRAIGIMEGDTIIWFWIGNHDDYKKFFG